MIRFFKTIPFFLNIITILAIVLFFLKIKYFNFLPELFVGASSLGIFIEGLFASILASYLFYLIVVHIKEFNDKKAIDPYIKQWAENIVSDCRSQIREIAKKSGVNITLKEMTENRLIIAMGKIKPQSNAPLSFVGKGTANWFQYFCFHQVRIERAISKILNQMIYVDSELVALITDIDETTFFHKLRQVGVFVSVPNFSIILMDKDFYQFCQKCRTLDEYIKKHF